MLFKTSVSTIYEYIWWTASCINSHPQLQESLPLPNKVLGKDADADEYNAEQLRRLASKKAEFRSNSRTPKADECLHGQVPPCMWLYTRRESVALCICYSLCVSAQPCCHVWLHSHQRPSACVRFRWARCGVLFAMKKPPFKDRRGKHVNQNAYYVSRKDNSAACPYLRLHRLGQSMHPRTDRLLAATGLMVAGLAALEVWRLQRQLKQAAHECQRQIALRQQERAGRTAAEQQLRRKPPAQLDASGGERGYQYVPIGHLSSCFVERRGTPRQSLLAPAARAVLRLNSTRVQSEALEGLERFSHVWLVYEFHENTNAAKQQPQLQVRAKIHPPALGGASIGLFATRTPHRPNAIGLSIARLLKVDGVALYLGGADVVDGTPIFDIKPYLPFDAPSDATVPEWCRPVTLHGSRIREVRFSDDAIGSLHLLAGSLRLFEGVAEARAAIEEVLRLDIRSVHRGRGLAGDGRQMYRVCLDTFELQFETYESHVQVVACGLRKQQRAKQAERL